MKHKGIFQYIYLLIFAFIIAGCNSGGDQSQSVPATGQKGNLNIVLKDDTNKSRFSSPGDNGANTRSLANDNKYKARSAKNIARTNSTLSPSDITTNQPALNLQSDSFVISGQGPDNAAFEIEVNDRQERTLEGLATGKWTISVIAKNSDGVEFANGQQEVIVRSDDTTQSVVDVEMIRGKGTFDFEVAWPKNIALYPVATAQLKSSEGTVVSELALEVTELDAENWVAKARIGESIDSGYYALVFTVHDGNSAGDKLHLATGFAETVRVIADKQTTVNQALKGVKGVGSLDIGIALKLNGALPIDVLNPETYPTQFAYDSNTSFTVNADVPGSDPAFGSVVKTWYLNGHVVEMGDSYTVNAASSPLPTTFNGKFLSGHYRLDVVGFSVTGERSGSASFNFEVTGEQITVAEPAGSLIGYVHNGMEGALWNYDLKLITKNGVEYQGIERESSTGQFSAQGVPAGSYILEINKKDYLTYRAPIKIESNRRLNLDVIRLYRGYKGAFDASQGTTIQTGDEDSSGFASIKFPADAIVNQDGTPYVGTVNVSHAALNPSSQSFAAAFPGGFTGLSTDDNGEQVEVDIISYGVIAAELTDDNGKPLKLASGKTAEISIKVANPAVAPETMPLWHLDPQTGKWTEEGMATLVGDSYVGQVSHFSWWNFDYPCGTSSSRGCTMVSVEFEVTYENGKAAPYSTISLEGKDTFAYSKNITTDHLGRVKTRLPFSPIATQQPSALVSYTVQAEENQLDLSKKEVLKSKLEPLFLASLSGKGYTKKLILEEPQPHLFAEAKVNGEWNPLDHSTVAVKVRQPAQSGDVAIVDFRMENKGDRQLNVEALEIMDANGGSASDWAVKPTYAMNLAPRAQGSFKVTYSGSDWTQNKATLIINSNDRDGTLNVPLITVDKNTTTIERQVELAIMDKYDGEMGYRTQVDPYAPDPYAPGASDKVPYVNDGTRYPNFSERAGNQRRAYFAFDLSQIPNGASIKEMTLVQSQYQSGNAHIYLGQQPEVLTKDLVNKTFDSPCNSGDSKCRFGTLQHTSWGSMNTAALNKNALDEALRILELNNKVLKLMMVNDDPNNWGGYTYLDNLSLQVKYEY